MDITYIRGLFDATTIQGAMCFIGGLGWGLSHGDWATGGTLMAVGLAGIVMKESPAKVIADAKSIIGQAQNVKVEAQQVVNATGNSDNVADALNKAEAARHEGAPP